jgi:hypothetical protein
LFAVLLLSTTATSALAAPYTGCPAGYHRAEQGEVSVQASARKAEQGEVAVQPSARKAEQGEVSVQAAARKAEASLRATHSAEEIAQMPCVPN